MRVAAVVLLLAGASSAQVLFSLQRLGDPRSLFRLPTITLLRDPPPPQAATAAPDYKQQVQLRNAECYQQCAAEFATAAGSADACERGCRLFALGEANHPTLTAGEHREACTKDCATAYPVLVEQHSCQSGCHHQRPKQQDEDGMPVVMSVVRKYSFESEDGQQVRRSQSSVVVHDGDQTRVIEGPAQISVTRHAPAADDSPFPSMLDDMIQRMRQTMQHMMLHLNGPDGMQQEHQQQQQQEEEEMEQKMAEDQFRDRLAQPRQSVFVTAGVRPSDESSWRRAWSCAPPYVVLSVLVLGTALVLYTCYCLVCVVRRRRRRHSQQLALVQDEEVAGDLPPKYSLATDDDQVAVQPTETKEAPPAYSAITATDGELPPKPDV